MNLSEYFQASIVGWIRGTTMPTAPSALTIALSTSDPTDDGSGLVEPTGGYTRQTITFGAPSLGVSGVTMSSDIPVVFGVSTASWGTITHVAIFDGANMLFHGALAAPKAVPSGDTFSFSVGNIQHTFKASFSEYFGTHLSNWVRGTVMPAAPATLDLALSTNSPNFDASGLSEPPLTDGYARQEITFGTPTFTSGVGTSFMNTNAIVFGPVNTTTWPTVAHTAIMAGTDLLLFGSLAASRSAEVGDSPPISIGAASFLVR